MIAVAKSTKVSRIGIDIGGTAGRAVQLTRSANRFVTTCAVQCEWSDSIEGTDAGAMDLGRLARLISRSRFRGKVAAASLSSPLVQHHLLELPAVAMSGDQQRAAQIVQNEFERLSSGPSEPVETRFWALPETKAEPTNAMGVALSRSFAERVVHTCEIGGIRCRRIGVGATALVRLAKCLRDTDEGIFGVLDIGVNQARLIIAVNGIPVLVRRAGSGSHAWTQEIAQALNLSDKAAEVHKRDQGIAATGSTPGSESIRAELPSLLLGALRRTLNELASEIKRSFEYVMRCHPDHGVSGLMLAGRGALMKNLPSYLGGALGIDVRAVSSYLQDSSCRLDFQSAHRANIESFAVAVGAALETMNGD